MRIQHALVVVGTLLFVVGLGLATVGPGMVLSEAPAPAVPGNPPVTDTPERTATQPATERSKLTPAPGSDADTPNQPVNDGETDETDETDRSAGSEGDDTDDSEEQGPSADDDTDDSDEPGPPDDRGPPGEDGPPGKSGDRGKDK